MCSLARGPKGCLRRCWLAFRLDGVEYFDPAMQWGLRNAVEVAHRHTAALPYMLNKRGVSNVFGVIDDFMLMEEADSIDAQRRRGESTGYDTLGTVFDAVLGENCRHHESDRPDKAHDYFEAASERNGFDGWRRVVHQTHQGAKTRKGHPDTSRQKDLQIAELESGLRVASRHRLRVGTGKASTCQEPVHFEAAQNAQHLRSNEMPETVPTETQDELRESVARSAALHGVLCVGQTVRHTKTVPGHDESESELARLLEVETVRVQSVVEQLEAVGNKANVISPF